MERVREEKELVRARAARFTALRNGVHAADERALRRRSASRRCAPTPARTRERIEASPFTKGVRGAMNDFFAQIRGDLERASQQSGEIHDMMRAMYARFANEHGLEPFMPPPFSMLKYQKEVERLERAYNTHFNTLWNMVSKAKFALMKRFFETVASRVKHVYDIANRDVEAWLKAVMAPLETQVREHHLQLRRRLGEHQADPPARATSSRDRIAEARAGASARRSTRSCSAPDRRSVVAIDGIVRRRRTCCRPPPTASLHEVVARHARRAGCRS